MSDGMNPLGKTACARVLWTVAVLETPTVREVAEHLEIGTGSASTQMRRLWRSNLVARRKRQTNDPGTDPYEYAIRIPEET